MNSWAKVSVGLVVFAFINLTIFIAMSGPFEDVLQYIEGEAEDMEDIHNEFFDIPDYTISGTVTVDLEYEREKTGFIVVSVKNSSTDEWNTIPLGLSGYMPHPQSITVFEEAMDIHSSQIHVKYAGGTIKQRITPLFGMIRTIFGMTFVLSMVTLGVWFFLGAHKEEHRQF